VDHEDFASDEAKIRVLNSQLDRLRQQLREKSHDVVTLQNEVQTLKERREIDQIEVRSLRKFKDAQKGSVKTLLGRLRAILEVAEDESVREHGPSQELTAGKNDRKQAQDGKPDESPKRVLSDDEDEDSDQVHQQTKKKA
jgi:hypothetical protein